MGNGISGREIGIQLSQRDGEPVLQNAEQREGLYFQWDLEVCR